MSHHQRFGLVDVPGLVNEILARVVRVPADVHAWPPPAPTWAPWEFGPEGVDFYREVATLKDRLIARALCLAEGEKLRAAHLLRVHRTTLAYMLKRGVKREARGV